MEIASFEYELHYFDCVIVDGFQGRTVFECDNTQRDLTSEDRQALDKYAADTKEYFRQLVSFEHICFKYSVLLLVPTWLPVW